MTYGFVMFYAGFLVGFVPAGAFALWVNRSWYRYCDRMIDRLERDNTNTEGNQ